MSIDVIVHVMMMRQGLGSTSSLSMEQPGQWAQADIDGVNALVDEVVVLLPCGCVVEVVILANVIVCRVKPKENIVVSMKI